MNLFLTLVSEICWTIVYIKSIQIGLKQKTYAMPLAALALNFAWEFIYSFEIFKQVDAITLANVVWFLFDADSIPTAV